MSILKPVDFNNYQLLSMKKSDSDQVQAYIDKYETFYILKLYGIKLGKLIIANITPGQTSPTNGNYKKIWDAFQEVLRDNRSQAISEGALEILKDCIFYHYIVETNTRHSISGVVKDNEDTANTGDSGRLAASRFNKSLESWLAIHAYINDNKSTYPDFIEIKPPSASFAGLL